MTSSKPAEADRREKKSDDEAVAGGHEAQAVRNAPDRGTDQPTDHREIKQKKAAGTGRFRARNGPSQVEDAKPGERRVASATQKAAFADGAALDRTIALQSTQLASFTQEDDQQRSVEAEIVHKLEFSNANLGEREQGLAALQVAKAAIEAELAVLIARLESTADAPQRERSGSVDLLRRTTSELQITQLQEAGARHAVLHSDERLRIGHFDDERTSQAAPKSDPRATLPLEHHRFVDIERALAEEREKNKVAKQRILSLEASIRLGLYETIEFKSRVTNAEKTSAELANELKALERAIHTNEAHLNSVFDSTSWRLTAPWRAYRRWLSRLSRVLRGHRKNPLFDRTWYVAQYPDVGTSEIDPFAHYLWHGVNEGRNPNCLFDTKWYLEKNPDVASSGINPLVHFYQFGAADGRDPHPVFSIAWHLDRISRGIERDTNPIATFIASLREVPQ
jgi:hypothetical protein